MTKKVLTIAAIGVAAMMFSGCASAAENMMAQGYGPNYSQGYGDGCSSGKKAGGSMFDQFKKDVNRFDGNRKYREGWDDGFKTCKSEFKASMRSIEANNRDRAIRDSYKKEDNSYDKVARDAARDSMNGMSSADRAAIRNLGN